MGSKYKRGKRINSISEYEKYKTENNQKVFWIQCFPKGYVKHIGWIENWQYRFLKRIIEDGFVFEAVLRRDDDET